MSHFSKAGAGLFIALATAGCSTGAGTAPAGSGRLVLQIATAPRGSSGAAPAPAAVTVSRGTDVVVISSVQLVARRIKLERAAGTCPAASLSEGESGGGDHNAGDTPECPTVRVGPFLLNPPLTDGAQTSFTADLPAGTYRELELRIDTPSAKAEDDAFRAAHPEFAGISIKVTGTFNGIPFSFTSDLEAEQEIEFPKPIELVEGATTSITLLLDVRGWFLDHDGALLVNPGRLDQATRSRVESNIRKSFRSFEDRNGDGHED